MSSQRYKREDCDEIEHRRDVDHKRYRDVHRRSRSRSSSRNYSRGYHHHRRDSRSRSRSLERYKRRQRRSHSRSRSKSRNRHDSRRERHYSSRHHESRSKSRSQSRSTHEKRKDNFGKNISDSQTIIENDSSSSVTDNANLENMPLPSNENVGAYYNLDVDEPIDKERIHREIEEKLRQTLAKEGKVYPPKKPEASHPVFANDGSFLEIFKKMQEAQKQQAPGLIPAPVIASSVTLNTVPQAYLGASATVKPQVPPPPFVGRRRGGKILKTGLVAKPKASTEANTDPKDFWALYLAEVNKYKNNACESESGNRPLVK